MQWLTRRDYSQQEIAQKLQTKGYASDATTEVVAELEQIGLIDDRRFAENYIHWRKQRGYGPLRILMELKARGISEEMIAELLKITDNAWLTVIQKVWEKHFKAKLPSDFKHHNKQIRFFQYRGFTIEQIKSVIPV